MLGFRRLFLIFLENEVRTGFGLRGLRALIAAAGAGGRSGIRSRRGGDDGAHLWSVDLRIILFTPARNKEKNRRRTWKRRAPESKTRNPKPEP